MKVNPTIFKKNDIRGRYGTDFDLDFVKALAPAFIRLTQKKLNFKKLKIAVGHDSRLSSPEIANHLTVALSKAGAEVVFLNMLPSPVCFFASYYKKLTASIMVTASHNPAEFNGFKMMLKNKWVCDEEILELKKIVENLDFKKTSLTGQITSLDISKDYISYCLNNFKNNCTMTKDKNLKKLNIAIDCGNGVAGPLAQKILNSLDLPLKIHWLYPEPDGHFPHHHPDPSDEKNLTELKKKIKKNKCDFGVAFDGDGDRLVILDSTGHTLNGDELMFIFISDLLKTSVEKFSVVVDVKCADWFFDFLKEKEISVKIARSGHSLIRRKTLKEQAIFGGEVAGHYYFGENPFPIDDGIQGVLRIISICLKNNQSLGDLQYKKALYETSEIRIPITNEKEAQKKATELKCFYQTLPNANCLFIDGIRVSFPKKAWGIARFSNTQSEWTLRFGGSSLQNLKKLQEQFYQILKK